GSHMWDTANNPLYKEA
nr:Chain A, Integrin Beta3 [Homo sapiens]1MK9_C Chain C, Integrin Beta3 [Homo sapiens]1MK9_E Chain E, Integrin Beta3 [Homo sapiens]1MK9_G Chain G, Integrin Beta3 [Homo sapiens]